MSDCNRKKNFVVFARVFCRGRTVKKSQRMSFLCWNDPVNIYSFHSRFWYQKYARLACAYSLPCIEIILSSQQCWQQMKYYTWCDWIRYQFSWYHEIWIIIVVIIHLPFTRITIYWVSLVGTHAYTNKLQNFHNLLLFLFTLHWCISLDGKFNITADLYCVYPSIFTFFLYRWAKKELEIALVQSILIFFSFDNCLFLSLLSRLLFYSLHCNEHHQLLSTQTPHWHTERRKFLYARWYFTRKCPRN